MKYIFLTILLCFSINSSLLAQRNRGVANDDIKIEIEKRIKDAKKKGARFSVVGTIEANRKSYLMVNGESIRKTDATRIIGKAGVGSKAKVKGNIVNGEKIASHIISKKLKVRNNKSNGDEKKSFDGELLNTLN